MTFLLVSCPSIFDFVLTEKYAAGLGAHSYLLTFELNGSLQEMQKTKDLVVRTCALFGLLLSHYRYDEC